MHQLGIQFSITLTVSSVDIYFTFYRNIKFQSLKHKTLKVLVRGLIVREYKFAASNNYRESLKLCQ